MTDPLIIGLFRGQFTEELARQKLSKRIPEGHVFIDGHDPFNAPNFGSHMGTLPKNLDLVEIDLATGNVAAIYEVKSTAEPEKREFNVNGQCGIFMSRAADMSIPTYLLVVRMDRNISEGILKENPDTKEVYSIASSELADKYHFLKNAKFELYGADKFRMNQWKFEVFGEPLLL